MNCVLKWFSEPVNWIQVYQSLANQTPVLSKRLFSYIFGLDHPISRVPPLLSLSSPTDTIYAYSLSFSLIFMPFSFLLLFFEGDLSLHVLLTFSFDIVAANLCIHFAKCNDYIVSYDQATSYEHTTALLIALKRDCCFFFVCGNELILRACAKQNKFSFYSEHYNKNKRDDIIYHLRFCRHPFSTNLSQMFSSILCFQYNKMNKTSWKKIITTVTTNRRKKQTTHIKMKKERNHEQTKCGTLNTK